MLRTSMRGSFCPSRLLASSFDGPSKEAAADLWRRYLLRAGLSLSLGKERVSEGSQLGGPSPCSSPPLGEGGAPRDLRGTFNWVEDLKRELNSRNFLRKIA
jgi:hypothetical protein